MSRAGLLLALLLAVAPCAVAQPPGYAAEVQEFDAGLKLKARDKRLAAVEKFTKCGEPAAVRVLVERGQQASRRLAKLREDYERVGRKIQEELVKRVDDRARDNKMPAGAVEQAEKEIAPLRKEHSALGEAVDDEEQVRDALLRGAGALIIGIGKDRQPQAIQALVDCWQRAAQVGDRVDVLRAAGEVEDPAAATVLVSALKLGDVPAVRVAALEAMLRRPREEFEPPAIDALKDEAWPVRSAAMAVLRSVGGREAVGALIAALGREEGRMIDEVVAALRGLTKADFHDNATLWKEWWEKSQGRFEGRGESAKVGGASEPGRGAPEKDGKGTYFYGLRTRSKHIVFVLDISNSMNYALDDPAKGQSTPAAAGKRRIDGATKELLNAISGIEEDGTFNIVFFHTEVFVWQKKMQKATKEAKAQARAWAEKIVATGNTNIFDGLERAFTLVGRGSFDKHYGVGADTIMFLSDGVANRGRIVAVPDILREVKRLNDLQRVQIHCVALSVGADEQLMRSLAAENGGQFVHVK